MELDKSNLMPYKESEEEVLRKKMYEKPKQQLKQTLSSIFASIQSGNTWGAFQAGFSAAYHMEFPQVPKIPQDAVEKAAIYLKELGKEPTKENIEKDVAKHQTESQPKTIQEHKLQIMERFVQDVNNATGEELKDFKTTLAKQPSLQKEWNQYTSTLIKENKLSPEHTQKLQAFNKDLKKLTQKYSNSR